MERDIIVFDPSRGSPTVSDASGTLHFSKLPMIAVPHGSPMPQCGKVLSVRSNYDLMFIRLLQGIDFCLGKNVDVLNLSVGPSSNLPSTLEDPDPLYVAADAARQLGIPVVTAAGNEGPAKDTLQFLARAPWTTSVGATGSDGKLLDSSSRGVPDGPMPTVVSFGTIDKPDPRFPEPSTSFAAPKVAVIAGWVKIVLMLIGRDATALSAGGSVAVA